jgi:hypothetical protein
MTEQSKDFEAIRRMLKREKKETNVYTKNRIEAGIDDARRIDKKAEKEIRKEFGLDRWHR